MPLKSIDDFRTKQFRVIRAESYFRLNLEKEVNWNEEHIEKLHLQAKDPDLFHRSRTSHEIEDHHQKHFKEHVLDSIPFHKKILEEHKHRLRTLLEIMPEKTYKKIHKISMKYDSHPDYLIFDKINKTFFFVIETATDGNKAWSRTITKKNIGEVLFLDGRG